MDIFLYGVRRRTGLRGISQLQLGNEEEMIRSHRNNIGRAGNQRRGLGLEKFAF